MKKIFFIVSSFIFLLFILIFTTIHSNSRIDDFFKMQKNISDLVLTNKNFNIFMSSSISYNNFDLIQKDIFKIKSIIKQIKKSELLNNELNSLKPDFEHINKLFEKKIINIEKLKSSSAVLNNSYRYIQTIYEKSPEAKLSKIYTKLIGLELNSEIEINKLKTNIEKIKIKSDFEKIFIEHAKNILFYYNRFNKLTTNIKNLELKSKLEEFEKKYNNYSYVFINDLKLVLWSIIIIFAVSLLIFLYYYSKIAYQKIQLNRFKTAVQNSDNIIMITDYNKIIKYVNDNFENYSGYERSEIIGQKASILKSGLQSKSFYKNLNETIYAGHRWMGEFINKTKNKELIYEKASISPIFDEKGNILEFLAIKLDITNERKIEKELKNKEHILMQQAKMVALHELLDSISHQWRQPLSAISTAASGIKLNKEFDSLDDKTFNKLMDSIIDNTQYLSKTIDDFKNFFKTDNENRLFNIKETINKVFNLLSYKFNENKIELIKNIENISIEGLEHELIQSLVNLFNNAQDATKRNLTKESRKLIFLNAYGDDTKNLIIKIKDNANGIDDKIIDKIFEPYFTTKHQSQGTGVGLYMTYEIISKHFNGKIYVKNVSYVYENIEYKGAEFTIKIPTKIKY
ncbi:PAS domain-containing sensor histidine kinase [Arcobacter sp. CECT 8985]|uniref:PAS domain-containing sensor histidine kinase n=1 Tax=Arcobacter sp. CECT 8985 TaxID=1935424 RepID=UPI00100A68C6|nr:PAS domain-containing sensor histidine kinase [Arcobacter sp. CECT 8985]RXJ86172.1 hypothetical protein CRU93_09980 [Arcobacter sp. CECT 8985]